MLILAELWTCSQRQSLFLAWFQLVAGNILTCPSLLKLWEEFSSQNVWAGGDGGSEQRAPCLGARPFCGEYIKVYELPVMVGHPIRLFKNIIIDNWKIRGVKLLMHSWPNWIVDYEGKLRWSHFLRVYQAIHCLCFSSFLLFSSHFPPSPSRLVCLSNSLSPPHVSLAHIPLGAYRLGLTWLLRAGSPCGGRWLGKQPWDVVTEQRKAGMLAL